MRIFLQGLNIWTNVFRGVKYNPLAIFDSILSDFPSAVSTIGFFDYMTAVLDQKIFEKIASPPPLSP